MTIERLFEENRELVDYISKVAYEHNIYGISSLLINFYHAGVQEGKEQLAAEMQIDLNTRMGKKSVYRVE